MLDILCCLLDILICSTAQFGTLSVSNILGQTEDTCDFKENPWFDFSKKSFRKC